MWPRKRLDIDWSDLAFGVRCCLLPADQALAANDAEQAFCGDGHSLACLSVRSGFDLFLSTVNLPHGSEVLVSAITIPDMVRIIEHHGLIPVPIDVNSDTGVPAPAEIARATTPNTRAVLIAHLFGAVPALQEHIAEAHARGLLFIEDCAQAFRGREFSGHPDADVSMFSFGTIKRATALGGAILRVRDKEILGEMRVRHGSFPLQSRATYLRRILKYTVFKMLETRMAFAVLVWMLRMLGRDHDRWVNSLVRGFPAEQLFRLIRRRPSAPLLKLLARRLCRFDSERETQRSARGCRLVEALHETLQCPAAFVEPHGYWVFPISMGDPESTRRVLLENGFDSTQGQSLVVVAPPDDRPHDVPAQAQSISSRLLLLPFYPSLPDAELDRMARVLQDHAERQAPLECGDSSPLLDAQRSAP